MISGVDLWTALYLFQNIVSIRLKELFLITERLSLFSTQFLSIYGFHVFFKGECVEYLGVGGK